MFNKDISQDAYNRLGKLQCEIQHDATQSLRSLFRAKWLEVKGSPFADKDAEYSDANINELENELRHIVPDLRSPVDSWDITVVCTALTAKSFKNVMYNALQPTTKKRFLKSVMCNNLNNCGFGSKCMYAHSEIEMLNSRVYNGYKTKMCMKHPYCSHGDECTFAHTDEELRFKENIDEKYYQHFSVIVESGIITENDLRHRYLQAFIACSWNVTEAVQTLRFVRNIICHMKGDSQGTGLCVDVFECLWQLVTSARQCVEHATIHTTKHYKPTPFVFSDFIKTKNTQQDTIDASFCFFKSRVRSITSWSHEDVLGLFEKCNFPTQGIKDGLIDGQTLIALYEDADAENLFTNAYPDGLGLNKLMYKGRLKTELKMLQ